MTKEEQCGFPEEGLPPRLLERGFRHRTEYAWPGPEALEVIGWLSENGFAVCGVEVWLPSQGGPEIPSPFIYTWSSSMTENESWREYAHRSNSGAKSYIVGFAWDPQDLAHRAREPFFNLADIREDDLLL